MVGKIVSCQWHVRKQSIHFPQKNRAVLSYLNNRAPPMARKSAPMTVLFIRLPILQKEDCPNNRDPEKVPKMVLTIEPPAQ